MKPQQLAKLLNVADSTLRLWAGREYAEFLSPSAQGPNGARRSFSDQDSRILAWVAILRAQNMPSDDIRAILKDSQAGSWRNLPPLPGGMAGDEPIAVVPREAVEERVRALEDRFQLQVNALERERDRLQQELERERRQLQARLDQAEAEKAELRQRLDIVTDQLLELNKRLTSLLEKEQKRRK